MFPADRRTMGELPARDHRPDVDIAKRNVIRCYQVEGRDPVGRWIGRGKQNSSDSQNSVGDLAGMVLIPETSRTEPLWSLALPSLATEPTTPFESARFGSPTTTTTAPSATAASRGIVLAPILNRAFDADDRLARVDASNWRFHTGIPRGQPGVLAAATAEKSEERLWLPSDIPLMSVQYGGPSTLSSVVYEASAGSVDPNNATNLNTLVRIDALPQSLGRGGGAKRSMLCWQLGDARSSASHGPCVQEEGNSTAARRAGGFAGHLRGGPLDILNARKEHLIGLSARRFPVYPVGCNILTLWRDDKGHDAPLDFEQVPYSEPPPRPLLTPCHIRHNEKRDHDWIGGTAPGFWQIEAEVPYMEPEDKDGSGGDDVILFELGAVAVGAAEAAARAALGGAPERVTTFPGAMRSGGGLRFRSFATADGEPSAATGGAIAAELRRRISKAPDSAAFVAVARGDGRWDGFKNSREWSPEYQALNDGGVMLIPPRLATPEGVADILAGRYATSGDDQTPDEIARLVIPEKLAGIDFARVSSGYVEGSGVTRQITRSGIRLRTSDADGLEAAILDTTGDPSGVVPLAVLSSGLIQMFDNGTNHQTIATNTLTANRTQTFLDESGTLAHRESMSAWFGDASDGDATITGGTTDLERDTFYDDLRIESSGVLETRGYRVFARSIAIASGGSIRNAGADASGSTAGSGADAGTLGGGADGADGGSGAGAGGNGDDADPGLGGGGGDADANTGGVVTLPAERPRSLPLAALLRDRTGTRYLGGGGGAGGAGGGGANDGGGGGGGGGVIYIAARSISVEAGGAIEAVGGDGGAATGVGSDGGGGGGGGAIIVVYQDQAGLDAAVDVSGGAGGAATAGGTAGAVGASGSYLKLRTA